jgi:hypothetical protein
VPLEHLRELRDVELAGVLITVTYSDNTRL